VVSMASLGLCSKKAFCFWQRKLFAMQKVSVAKANCDNNLASSKMFLWLKQFANANWLFPINLQKRQTGP